MKRIIKRLLVLAYCHGLLAQDMTQRIYDWMDLKGE